MMKTLCVALVVLSLVSVCQSASLTCDKLLHSEDKSPDMSGKWYIIALTSDYCLIPTLVYAVLWPSIEVDLTAGNTQNVYIAKVNFKMYGLCSTETERFFYGNNSLFNVDSKDAPTGKPDLLLKSGCPDCVVLKGDDFINTLLLMSRRKTVTADELKEFETQAACAGLYAPVVLDTEHDYGKCQLFEDENVDAEALSIRIYERLSKTYMEPLKCVVKAVCDWFKQWVNSFW